MGATPFLYFFKTSAPDDTVLELIVSLIRQLNSVEVFVKAVICDQGPNNYSLTRKLDIFLSQPYFVVDDSKIYFIFDPPHLMKTTRNLLPKHYVQIGDLSRRFSGLH